MVKHTRRTTIIGAFVALLSLAAVAATFGGIEFPEGDKSFADEVEDYDPEIVDGEPTDDHRDPTKALGPPDCPEDTTPDTRPVCSVSLGSGGSIELEFTDNQLTGNDNPDADLWIFEVGPDVESTFVEISTDGEDWEDIGKVGGSTTGVDIDQFGFGPDDEFNFVRLTDDPDEGAQDGVTVGADIDAVGANPESVAGVRCLHDPLWPQGGDDGDEVTITAESLDAGVDPPDTVEIWVNDRSEPKISESDTRDATYTAGPFDDGDTFFYGCRVEDDGDSTFSGWRRTQVGEPDERPVPVVYNEADTESIDVLLVPDENSYSGPTDSDWLEDALPVIRDFYYDEEVFLTQQRGLNFWLAQDMGSVDIKEVDDGPDECTNLTGPDGFGSDYAFADTVGVFHTDNCRDLAGTRLFSSESGSKANRVILHETGHSPFGLADEYCCDGGYGQREPKPNVYETQSACEEDASDVDRSPSKCRSWMDDEDDPNRWWTSDPPNNDLMNDNLAPRALDIRRIEWLFGQCARRLPDC